MPPLIRRSYAVLFACLLASLCLPQLVSAQTTFVGTLLEHQVERGYRSSSRCPIPQGRRPRNRTDIVEPVDTFLVTDIPSRFSCEIMRFTGGAPSFTSTAGSGEGEFTIETGDLTIELDDPTALPDTVTLADPSAVNISLGARGRGMFTNDNDEHSARVGVAIGLEAATRRADQRVARDPSCVDDQDYTTSTTRARNITAQASCSVSVLNVVPSSVMTDGVQQGVVTEFVAEIISDFYFVLDHGDGSTGRGISNGAQYTVTIRSRYRFRTQGVPSPPSCRFSPQNSFVPMHLLHVHTVDPMRFRHLVRVKVEAANGNLPAGPVDVTIAASENVLSDPGGGLTSELTDQTGPDGFVEFEYNPPAGDFFEQIDFAATSTVTGEEVACSGAVMVGTAPRLGGSGAVASFQRALAGLVPGIDGRGDHSEAYLSYRAEITQILLDHPDALREFRGRLNQHRSLLRALGEGRGARISQDQYQALLKAINFLKKNANYPLLSALEELQDFITFPGHLALYGIEITEATDGERAAREPAAAVKPRLLRRAGGHTPSFEANLGQFAEEVLYSGRAAGYSLHLKRDGAVITASPVSQLGVTKSAEVGLRLVGSSAKAEVRTSRKKPATSHYILGADSDQWISGVPHFGEVRYGKVYPGVDLVFYGRPGRFEYDFIVAPGADPDPIAMAFDGVSDFRKDDSGALLGRTRAGELRLEPPVVYQIVEGEKHLIAGAYSLGSSGEVGFELGAYDSARRLTIDPVISFATLFGGLGGDAASAVAIDPDGNVIVTGFTSSADLPGRGSADGFAGGSALLSDVFVMKLDPTGTNLLYSVYLGGADDDLGHDVAVDDAGNAYVVGATRSSDFPIKGGPQAQFGGGDIIFGTDAFVAKLSPTGELLESTFLGGSGDEAAMGVAVPDAADAVIVAGFPTSSDFPTTAPLQAANNGGLPVGSDGFVAKLSTPGLGVEYATYLGGSGDDMATAVAASPAGEATVVGLTRSPDFPLAAALQENNLGGADAFVSRLSADGAMLVYSTNLGGAGDDHASSVALDAAGRAYVAGVTGSTDLPTVNALQAESGNATTPGFDAFLSVLNAAGSALDYATYLGGSGIDLAAAVAVDPAGQAYVVGGTTSADFPTANANQAMTGGLVDGFFVQLTADGDALASSTYFGGSQNDTIEDVAVAANGSAFVAAQSRSTDAPATFGAFQTAVAGEMDALVARIDPGATPLRIASVSAASFDSTAGLAPQAIASGFGSSLASSVEVATTLPLPTTLGGLSIRITDSEGTVHEAQLFFVSPGQVNFLVLAGVADGLALVTVLREGQAAVTGTLPISQVAPALFSADASGAGVAAAFFLRLTANNDRTQQLVFDASSREAIPIDLGPQGDQVFLLLFGGGFRGFAESVTATVNGVAVPVLGAVPQGEFVGLDQINIGPLPASLAGSGEVEIVLIADGKVANTVTVAIK